MKVKYFECIDCKEIVDFFQYDNLNDTGHEGHNIRMIVDKKEIKACEKECKEFGCQ